MSKNEKLAAYIGFSIKSGKVIYGYEGILVAKRKIPLVICDPALSENSRKKLEAHLSSLGMKTYELEDLPSYCGGKNVKCIGLTEEHLASAAEKELINRR